MVIETIFLFLQHTKQHKFAFGAFIDISVGKWN